MTAFGDQSSASTGGLSFDRSGVALGSVRVQAGFEATLGAVDEQPTTVVDWAHEMRGADSPNHRMTCTPRPGRL